MSDFKINVITMYERNGKIVGQAEDSTDEIFPTIDAARAEAEDIINFYLKEKRPYRFRSPWRGFSLVRFDNAHQENAHTAIQVVEFTNDGGLRVHSI